jgi:hypothetical protein
VLWWHDDPIAARIPFQMFVYVYVLKYMYVVYTRKSNMVYHTDKIPALIIDIDD